VQAFLAGAVARAALADARANLRSKTRERSRWSRAAQPRMRHVGRWHPCRGPVARSQESVELLREEPLVSVARRRPKTTDRPKAALRETEAASKEEQLIEQLKQLLAGNARLREILLERGTVPPRDERLEAKLREPGLIRSFDGLALDLSFYPCRDEVLCTVGASGGLLRG
jgi:hypothetical protein